MIIVQLLDKNEVRRFLPQLFSTLHGNMSFTQDKRQGTVKNGVQTGGGLGFGYFHKPEELKAEIEDGGFIDVDIRSGIGPCWLIRNLDRTWKNDKKREKTMRVVRLMEKENSIIGLSTYFLSISHKEI